MNGYNISNAINMKVTDASKNTSSVAAVYLGDEQIWPEDNSIPYLTTKAVGSGKIGFYCHISSSAYSEPYKYKNNYDIILPFNYVSYSKNNGSWVTVNAEDMEINGNGRDFYVEVQVSNNDVIRWKSDAICLAGWYGNKNIPSEGRCRFDSVTCTFEVSGSVLSMMYGDTFRRKQHLQINRPYCFNGLFHQSRCSKADNLILPKNIGEKAVYCFAYMFCDCPYLTSVPEIQMNYAPYRALMYFVLGCRYVNLLTLKIDSWNTEAFLAILSGWFVRDENMNQVVRDDIIIVNVYSQELKNLLEERLGSHQNYEIRLLTN